MSISIYLVLLGLLLGVALVNGVQDLPPSNSDAAVSKITQDAYNWYTSPNPLALVKQGDNTYIAGVPGPIKDPCQPTYHDWFTANYPAFQAWANSHCQPYRGAFGNNCICVLFQVNPQIPPCKPWLQYQYADAIKVPLFLANSG